MCLRSSTSTDRYLIMAKPLLAAQARYLRSLGHPLKAVILVGAKGVTPALLAELGETLNHHELLKVKVSAGDRSVRDAWIAQLLAGCDATLVQRIGNTALLYRRHPENPQIVLPTR